MIKYIVPRLIRMYLRQNPSLKNRILARDTLRKWCVDKEFVVTTLHGFKMAVSPNDYASYGIYFFGEYDPSMTAFIHKYVMQGDVCWDVGTERGWFTLVMAKTVGTSGRVDAFEAYFPNYEKLVNNIALNNYDHVNAVNIAVSDRTGTLYFVPPSDEITHHVDFLENCSGVGYVAECERSDTVPVKAITLDEYVCDHPLKRLDFIKIDIEGEELRALRGAALTLSQFRPIIAIEYNRETSVRAGSSIEELDALLDDLGYDRFGLEGDTNSTLQLSRLKDIKRIPDVYNVYCFPKNDFRAKV